MRYINMIALAFVAILVATGVVVLGPLGLVAFAGVTTYDLTSGTLATSQGSKSGQSRIYQLMQRITIPLAGVTNDVVRAIAVKAGTKILGTTTRIVTAAVGTTLTLDLGITGGTANGFQAAFDGKAVAGSYDKMVPADTYGVTPHIVTADDTVDILLNTVTAITGAAVIDVMVLCEDVSTDPGEYTSPVVAGSA